MPAATRRSVSPSSAACARRCRPPAACSRSAREHDAPPSASAGAGGSFRARPGRRPAGSLADWPTQHRQLDRIEDSWLPGAPVYSACFARSACSAALQGSVPSPDNGRGCDVAILWRAYTSSGTGNAQNQFQHTGRDVLTTAAPRTRRRPPRPAAAALCRPWPSAHPRGRACPCRWAADPSPRRWRPHRPRPLPPRCAPRRRPCPPPPLLHAATARPPRSPRRRRRPASRAAAARLARPGPQQARRRSSRLGVV